MSKNEASDPPELIAFRAWWTTQRETNGPRLDPTSLTPFGYFAVGWEAALKSAGATAKVVAAVKALPEKFWWLYYSDDEDRNGGWCCQECWQNKGTGHREGCHLAALAAAVRELDQ